jgi:predicted nucleic acid-binding protein
MKPRVYIETSIPSFYVETRATPEMVARRQWTQRWWKDERQLYDVVTSEAVLNELSAGDYESKPDALRLLDETPLLKIDTEIIEIVNTYITHKLMPNDALGDAMHLAVASYHNCEFLLTWNCRHLANANKFKHIRRINTMLGLYVPSLVTPIELLGGK